MPSGGAVVFTVVDQFKRTIRLTARQHEHICSRQEMQDQEDRIRESIALPDVVKVSQHDPQVLCYYRWYETTPVTRKYLLCIVKVLNHEGFIITAFYTDKVKGGPVVWER